MQRHIFLFCDPDAPLPRQSILCQRILGVSNHQRKLLVLLEHTPRQPRRRRFPVRSDKRHGIHSCRRLVVKLGSQRSQRGKHVVHLDHRQQRALNPPGLCDHCHRAHFSRLIHPVVPVLLAVLTRHAHVQCVWGRRVRVAGDYVLDHHTRIPNHVFHGHTRLGKQIRQRSGTGWRLWIRREPFIQVFAPIFVPPDLVHVHVEHSTPAAPTGRVRRASPSGRRPPDVPVPLCHAVQQVVQLEEILLLVPGRPSRDNDTPHGTKTCMILHVRMTGQQRPTYSCSDQRRGRRVQCIGQCLAAPEPWGTNQCRWACAHHLIID